MHSDFSCFLMGADTLLMECGDILVREGHRVRGVISSAPRIGQWAADNGIPVVDPEDDYVEVLAAEPFDYLFAITHLAIIPDEVLALPQKLAVNFHDGPLPRYAGLNTPVWALMNRETGYGITWHVVTSGVDQGDILQQAMFEVSPGETALSLNTRCMATAVETFPELVRALAEGRESRTEQVLADRSYFGKFKRPPAASAIDWSLPSLAVDAFVGALGFGPYANPVGVPKASRMEVQPEPFIVKELRIRDESSADHAAPGEITEVSGTAITVATGDGLVSITQVCFLNGSDLSVAELAERYELSEGVMLDGVDSDQGTRLTTLDGEMCRAERFWTARLIEAEPPEVAQSTLGTGRKPEWDETPVDVPAGIKDQFGANTAAAVFAVWATYLARTGRKESFHLAFADPNTTDTFGALRGWFSSTVPLAVRLDPAWTFRQAVDAMVAELEEVRNRKGFLRDLVQRTPELVDRPEFAGDAILPVGIGIGGTAVARTPPGSLLSLVISEDLAGAKVVYDSNRLSSQDAEAIGAALSTCLGSIEDPDGRSWTDLPLVQRSDLDRLIVEWNETRVEWNTDSCVHQLFEAQVDRSPDSTALVFDDQTLTYRELDERANAVARYLRAKGVGADSLVGVHIERSVQLLVATLGVMKAGGAYVPLDPEFPSDRLAMMIDDSGAQFLLTQAHLASHLPKQSAKVIEIDGDWDDIEREGTERLAQCAGPSNLAYVIYTSGSTGRPKGVLVEHRNVVNFFTGMDAVIAHEPPGVWLAVTSLSFDISVLELFWTLARGFKVVIYPDHAPGTSDAGRQFDSDLAAKKMDFSLFLWGNDDGPGPSKYRLMMEGAKYFDQNGFRAVWTPERHFHAFGGPYPNPAVTGAALATVTARLSIRGGSCVSPLHHPIRIAEEWAVVDNLSDGRVGLSFAAGWQPNDFILRPESYGNQKQVMIDQIDTVRRLWRGEKMVFKNPLGDDVEISTLPRPVQKELPYWITTAGNPETYRVAGAAGANILTHLLGQSLEEVAEKIAIYREARREAGLDPAEGIISLMLHAFVGTDDDEIREIVRQPMKDFLGASMKLTLGFAWTFPAFKRPGGPDSAPEDVDLGSLSEEETDAILDFAFERYYQTSGLFGRVETCVEMVNACRAIDVDEIACLLDFGVDTELVMGSLPYLKEVKDASSGVSGKASSVQRQTFEGHVHDHRVTHLQCTPSMARLLMADDSARSALGEIDHLMIGGEAFPPALARDLGEVATGTITNMYGPTETTIWSSTHHVEASSDTVPIGRPIANTQMYVLDRYQQPLPPSIPGELYIGGNGVTRGYHERPDLTAERFVPDPFRGGDHGMYWTGDLARFREDGVIDFLGRVDHQVKLRGYRVELGEIEAALDSHENVHISAVLLREDQPGDPRLVGYVVPHGDALKDGELRDFLSGRLPEYMIPERFMALGRMPLTPNGKIDRKSLPTPAEGTPVARATYVEPANDVEQAIAACWRSTLQVDRVGVEDNFFDIGGHSLLVVQLHRALMSQVEHAISLVDLYRFPTIRRLTDHLSESDGDAGMQESIERAHRRRDVLAKRRERGR